MNPGVTWWGIVMARDPTSEPAPEIEEARW